MADSSFQGARTSALAQIVGGLAVLLGAAVPARAQQVVILDETYTATSANTNDSHYPVDPGPATPANWTSPVDYTQGKVHARFEVLSKPSDRVTLLNICFIGMPSYACMPYSDPYTATGTYDFEYAFTGFYQFDQVNWSQGIDTIQLILKAEDESKRQGDPDFYPTQMHVTLTLVPQGASFVPPKEMPDAGIDVDAAMPDAATPDAATPEDAGKPPMSGKPAKIDAGQPAVGGTGGSTTTPPAKPAIDAGERPSSNSGTSGGAIAAKMPVDGGDDYTSSCAVSPARRHSQSSAGSWSTVALALWWMRRAGRSRSKTGRRQVVGTA